MSAQTAALAKVLEVDRGSGTGYDPGGDISLLVADIFASTQWDVALEVHHPAAQPYRAVTTTKPPRHVRAIPGFEWPPAPGAWLPVLVSDRNPNKVDIDWDGLARFRQEGRTPLTEPPRLMAQRAATPLRDDTAVLAELRQIATETLPVLIAQVRNGSTSMAELTWYVREREAWGVLSKADAERWLQRAHTD